MEERSKDRIETPQLTLVRATLPLLEAEEAYYEACQRWRELPEEPHLRHQLKESLYREIITLYRKFKMLLGADAGEPSWADKGEPWPNSLEDFDPRDLTMLYLRSNPEWTWGMWYIVFKRLHSNDHAPICIGAGCFRGPPSHEGTVEIGYSILERYQCVDLATEAVGALVTHAFEDSRVRRVMAEAHARHVPTIRVLGKNGFRRTGLGRAPGCLLLQRDREVADEPSSR